MNFLFISVCDSEITIFSFLIKLTFLFYNIGQGDRKRCDFRTVFLEKYLYSLTRLFSRLLQESIFDILIKSINDINFDNFQHSIHSNDVKRLIENLNSSLLSELKSKWSRSSLVFRSKSSCRVNVKRSNSFELSTFKWSDRLVIVYFPARREYCPANNGANEFSIPTNFNITRLSTYALKVAQKIITF